MISLRKGGLQIYCKELGLVTDEKVVLGLGDIQKTKKATLMVNHAYLSELEAQTQKYSLASAFSLCLLLLLLHSHSICALTHFTTSQNLCARFTRKNIHKVVALR